MPKARTATLLLVEDETLLAMATANSLERQGYTVVIAGNGEKAIDIVRSGAVVDLVLMDVDLGPGIDGPDAAKAILEIRDLPVVFVSCRTDRELVEKTEAVASFGFVAKTSGISVLSSTIKVALKLYEARRGLRRSEERLFSVATRLLESDEKRKFGGEKTAHVSDFEDAEDLLTRAAARDEFLRQTQEISKIGGWEYDTRTGLVEWTDEAYKVYGVGRDFNVSDIEKLLSFFVPGDRERLASAFALCIEKGEYFDLELEILDAKSGHKWVRTIARAKCRDGKPLLIYGTIQDITERKLAQAALESANTRLEALWSLSGLESSDLKSTSDYILASIVTMTNSQYGFFGFINGDESEMNVYSWSGEAMKDCGLVDKPLSYVIRDVGVWGEAIRRREPFIMNDFSVGHPAKKGYPAGHVKLERILVVPFIHRGKIISVAAVSNKKADYVEADVRQIQAFLSGVQAIIERKKAEEELRAMVRQQETLMQELKHRVKNNLNIVSSLLGVEMPNLTDPAARKVFTDTQGRIRTIAAIYEQLYLSPELSGVDLSHYVAKLARMICDAHSSDGERIRLVTELEPVELDTKEAVPLGLILNELITNVFKYAYPGEGMGELRVFLAREEKRILLRVEDDGVGFPPGFDPFRSDSMGLRLVRMLVEQLDARLSFESCQPGKSGTRASVLLPTPAS